MPEAPLERLTPEEIAAECGTALPAKEVLSLLDLNANIDLLLDLAAPVDLAIGANANIAAPINAAVNANVLSLGSASEAAAVQTGAIHGSILGNATATSNQVSSIGQGTDGGGTAPTTTDTGHTALPGTDTSGTTPTGTDTGGTTPTGTDTGGTTPTGDATDVSTGGLLSGNLLNVNVNVNGNLHLASPINGAVAANANAAAPIDAAVSANIGTVDSSSTALAEQQVSIDQGIQGDATATAHQISGITQGSTSAGGSTPADTGAASTPADTGASTAAGTADPGATQPSG